MGNLKVHAGDFYTTTPHHSYSTGWGGNGSFHLATGTGSWGTLKHDSIPASDLVYLALANEEEVKKLGGTIGWGAAGALVLGPAGLLAGLLLGGKKTTVTFVAKFKDGRKFIASTDPKTWTSIQAGGLHLL